MLNDKQCYDLTDGYDIIETRNMNEQELYDAQAQAEKATDGNWYWVPSKKGEAKRRDLVRQSKNFLIENA